MRLIDSPEWDATYIELGDLAAAHLIVENDMGTPTWHIQRLVREAQDIAIRKAWS